MPFSLMVNVAELAGKVTCPALTVRRKVLAGIVGVYPSLRSPPAQLVTKHLLTSVSYPRSYWSVGLILRPGGGVALFSVVAG